MAAGGEAGDATAVAAPDNSCISLLNSKSSTVASEFVVGCGLEMSATGVEGTELNSTVGKRAAALDSSEMLLEREITKHKVAAKCSYIQYGHANYLPNRVGRTQRAMMMLWLIGATHGHASQELLKAAATLCHRRLRSRQRGCSLHGRRRGDISCHRRMMRLLCWLPGLGTWRELRDEWRGGNSICNRVAPIETALRIAAAAGSHQTATQQISTVRARGGRRRRRAEAAESMP